MQRAGINDPEGQEKYKNINHPVPVFYHEFYHVTTISIGNIPL
jgi:hypothetical protein